MDVFADRMARVFGRVGMIVAAPTAISCAACLAIPFIAEGDPEALPLFIATIVVWAVTSSTAALAIGATGAERRIAGLMFSALALAMFARMAVVSAGLVKLPAYANLVTWMPVACWVAGGAALVWLGVSRFFRRVERAEPRLAKV